MQILLYLTQAIFACCIINLSVRNSSIYNKHINQVNTAILNVSFNSQESTQHLTHVSLKSIKQFFKIMEEGIKVPFYTEYGQFFFKRNSTWYYQWVSTSQLFGTTEKYTHSQSANRKEGKHQPILNFNAPQFLNLISNYQTFDSK